MTRPLFTLLSFVMLTLCGCLEDDSLSFIRRDPFGLYKPIEQRPVQLDPAPATRDAYVRTNLAFQKIIATDELEKVGLRPALRVIGDPKPAIFHRGSQELFITDGLVRSCDTPEKLAAVLALEMGDMVSERAAIATPASRAPKPLPPLQVPVGNDLGGNFGPADGVQLAELARYEKETKGGVVAPPDPTVLASKYLLKAGYDVNAIQDVTPILKKASRNARLERQLKRGAPETETWKPAQAAASPRPKAQPGWKPAVDMPRLPE